MFFLKKKAHMKENSKTNLRTASTNAGNERIQAIKSTFETWIEFQESNKGSTQFQVSLPSLSFHALEEYGRNTTLWCVALNLKTSKTFLKAIFTDHQKKPFVDHAGGDCAQSMYLSLKKRSAGQSMQAFICTLVSDLCNDPRQKTRNNRSHTQWNTGQSWIRPYKFLWAGCFRCNPILFFAYGERGMDNPTSIVAYLTNAYLTKNRDRSLAFEE
jgi:hypothetical protein